MALEPVSFDGREIEDWGTEAQRLAEIHLTRISDQLYEDADEIDSFGPFCGCQTCMIRETLFAAYPAMINAALNEAGKEPQMRWEAPRAICDNEREDGA